MKESGAERTAQQERAAQLKERMRVADLPVMDSVSHIVPLFIGNPVLCKEASDMLLNEYGIYVQPINYPTVPRGTERLRFTPGPLHDDKAMDALIEALTDVWQRLGLSRAVAV